VPEIERYVTRRAGQRLVVERATGSGPRETDRPLRIRGM
jgi:hypothetical protein